MEHGIDKKLKSALLKQISQHKQNLLSKLDAADKKAKSTLRETPSYPGDSVDSIRTSDIVSVKVIHNMKKQIHLCDFALERIKNGTYGTCTECGNAILVKRLRASPIAYMCTSCKEAKDKTDRINVSGSGIYRLNKPYTMAHV